MPDKFAKVHPDLRQSAKNFPGFATKVKYLWLTRRLADLMPAPKTPEDIHIENIFIPGQDGQTKVRLRYYRLKECSAPVPVMVWLHGGGYVLGKPEMDDSSCIQYVRQAGIAIVSVDYRLAPKHPFPAGLEDCYSALKWVKGHSEQLGIDSGRIAIGGKSAGGGLAAALVQLAHDRKEVNPVFQLLVYPMLDDRTALRTDIDDSCAVAWSQESNRYGWESHLGMKCGAENPPEYSVPARRLDLSGLAPAWIGVGTLDIFLDEDVAYARRLQESGVECDLQIIPGAFHGFDVFDPQIPVVRNFLESQISALKKALSPKN